MLYRYRAIDAEGSVQSGSVEGTNPAFVANYIREKGLVPMDIGEIRPSDLSKSKIGFSLPNLALLSVKSSRSQVAQFTQKLSDLTSAGMEINQALDILSRHRLMGALNSVVDQLCEDLRQGKSLAAGLASHNSVFPNYYVNMIRAGEAGGNLADTLVGLAKLLEQQQSSGKALRSTLVYPLILVLTAILSVVFLVVFVMPQFEAIFYSANHQLPASTRLFLDVSSFAHSYGLTMIAIFATIVVIIATRLRDDLFRFRVDSRLLVTPIIGSFILDVELSRFSRTTGFLLKGGVPLLAALQIVLSGFGNTALRKAFEEIREQVKDGRKLGRSLEGYEIMPIMFVQIVAVSELTGKMDEALLRLSDILGREVEHKTKRFVALLTPIITLSLAGIIALLITSILTALLSINDIAF